MLSLIDQFRGACHAIDDYTCEVESHIRKGSQHQHRIYRFWYKRPDHLRVEVLKSNALGDAGGVIVYNGGNEVQCHAGGLLSLVRLTLPLTSSRVTSVRGNPITHLSIPYLVDVLGMYEHTKGRIEQGPDETVEGHAARLVVLHSDRTEVIRQNDHIVKDMVWLDARSFLPLKVERYESEGRKPVVELVWRKVQVNVGLSTGVFNIATTVR